MKKKVALIFGATGQDGSYLSELLLSKNYIVHGVKRRSSVRNTMRVDHIFQEPFEKEKKFILHYGDVTDTNSINNIIMQIKPDVIYNLAAQSHVAVSFETPEYTANADALGTLRILEAIKSNNLVKKTKFYQAGTSEMFGNHKNIYLNEESEFRPVSPYGASKLYSHWITKIYRKAYNIFASNGILFNHESPRRGETFVTKKIIAGLCKIKLGKQKKLVLGNLYAKRDWGHAKDYVEAMYKIMQQKKPNDFVIATGQQLSVKRFIDIVSKNINYKITWRGKGINKKGYNDEGKTIIECHPKYFRPIELNSLKGNSKKARNQLKWKPKYNVLDIIKEMVEKELDELKKN
jgi:GDPmannose 4,6-dehydratase